MKRDRKKGCIVDANASMLKLVSWPEQMLILSLARGRIVSHTFPQTEPTLAFPLTDSSDHLPYSASDNNRKSVFRFGSLVIDRSP